MDENLWVVIPFYNESKNIGLTIYALADQTDRNFTLLLVDNASTDDSLAVAKEACQQYGLSYHIIPEPQKGTGAAADTGFRYAIDHGAQYIARTDADCSPAPDWIERIKAGFNSGLEFMGGRLKPRHDDIKPTLLDHILLPLLVWIGVMYGRLAYRGKQFKYPFFMAAGGNMAITAALYKKAGGFMRSSIADINEDTELAEVVRTMTSCAKYQRTMIVHASIRRVRKYGYLKTLRWFSDRRFMGEVDVR